VFLCTALKAGRQGHVRLPPNISSEFARQALSPPASEGSLTMPLLTAWGGVDEIGGNKFLLSEDGTRLLLDFGTSYDREGEFFEQPFLQAGCLQDYLKTGIVPPAGGLYRNGGLQVQYDAGRGPTGVCGEEEARSVDALLLSHAHVDHYGYAGLLRPDIPLYGSAGSCRVIRLRSDINETWNSKVLPDTLHTLEPGIPLQIGTFQVRAWPVDHSIPGAMAFILEAGGRKIGYTGDMRLHGPEEGRRQTLSFLNALAEERVDWLMCEGTRVHPVQSLRDQGEQQVESHALASERDVGQRVSEILAREKGLVVYDASAADLGRMKLVCQAAAAAGRRIAMDAKQAYLLLYMNAEQSLVEDLPGLEDIHIILSRRKLMSNSKAYKDLGREDLFAETFDQGRQDHERILLQAQFERSAQEGSRRSRKEDPEAAGRIRIPDERFIWGPKREEILRNPGEWLIYTGNGPLTCLHFLTAPGSLKGAYVYGKAEPFNQEMEFTFNRLLAWLKLAGLKLEYAHTSGHIRHQDLKMFLSECGAKHVIPIHTEAAGAFPEMHPCVRRIAPGEQLSLD